MSEEITPEWKIYSKHLRYLYALYRLGMHETMLMMENNEYAYAICTIRRSYNFEIF